MATCLLTKDTAVTIQDDLLVATAITGVYSLTISGAAVDNLERTDFSSQKKEYCPGLGDEGEVTLNIRTQNADAGQDILSDIYDTSAIREVVITDSQLYTRTFDSYVSSITETADTNALWDTTVVLKITGSVVKAAP